jgi:hypothetical protein
LFTRIIILIDYGIYLPGEQCLFNISSPENMFVCNNNSTSKYERQHTDEDGMILSVCCMPSLSDLVKQFARQAEIQRLF